MIFPRALLNDNDYEIKRRSYPDFNKI